MANTHSLDLELTSSQYAYITDAAQTGLDITGDLTLECWVKVEQLPSTSGTLFVLAAKWNGTTQQSWVVYFDNANKLNCYISSDGGSSNVSLTTSNAAFLVASDVGKWVHVAISLDVSVFSAEMYKNGFLVANTVSTNNAKSIFNSTANFSIGANYSSGTAVNFFDGLIDDVRLWNDIRTAAEIGSNKNVELVGNEAGLVGYWKLNNSELDETSNNNDLTLGGSPVYSTDVSNNFKTQELNSTAALSDANLVYYWRLEGNSTDSKDSNNGTDTDITYSSNNGMFTQGAGFDGDSSKIALGHTISGASARTFSCWICPSAISGIDTVFSGGENANNKGFGIFLNAVSTNDIYIWFSGQDYYTATGAVVAGAWQHLVVVYDGGDISTSTVHVYVDNVSKSLTKSGVVTGAANTTDSGVNIGTDALNAGRFFQGAMDDVAFFNRALSSTEVGNLYGGTWPAASTGGKFMTPRSKFF